MPTSLSSESDFALAQLARATMVDEIALVGSADRIRDRSQAWKDAAKQRHVDSMLLSGDANTEALRVIAEAVF